MSAYWNWRIYFRTTFFFLKKIHLEQINLSNKKKKEIGMLYELPDTFLKKKNIGVIFDN